MASRLTLLVASVLLKTLAFGQDSSSQKFYEVIKDDSVRLFFNDEYKFIEKKCAAYTRSVKIDKQANFHGAFEDASLANALLCRGQYVNGKKQGYFEMFYTNGKMRSKGYYADDQPTGQWEFFYENGIPERTLLFTQTDTLLMKFSDEKGMVRVLDGNGEFNGLVTYPNTSNRVSAQGKVVHGKPDGLWTASLYGQVFCREEFKDAKLIRGSFPNSRGKDEKYYYAQTFITDFFPDNYLGRLEEFNVDKCPDITVARFPDFSKYDFDFNSFKTYLSPKIERIINSQYRPGYNEDYDNSEKVVSVEFSVNSEGKAEKFSLVSFWGDPFFTEIKEAIITKAVFQPTGRKMYFHLKINFPRGQSYHYSYRFSGRASAD